MLEISSYDPGMLKALGFGEDPDKEGLRDRAVNVLAAVHAAPPGIIESFSDLPFTPGRMR
jgi:hypothetical protein